MNDETLEYELPVAAAAMPGVKVAILGAGKMGGILLQAFLKNNLLHPEQIVATVAHPERAHALSAQYSVEVTTDNLGKRPAVYIVIKKSPTAQKTSDESGCSNRSDRRRLCPRGGPTVKSIPQFKVVRAFFHLHDTAQFRVDPDMTFLALVGHTFILHRASPVQSVAADPGATPPIL